MLRSYRCRTVLVLGVGLVALAVAATSARAAVILSEAFSYSVGDLGPASPANDGGTGWETGGWNITTQGGTNTASADVVAGSLAYGPLATSGNFARLDFSGGNTAIFRDPAAALGGAGSDLWFSFLIGATGVSNGISLFSGATELSFIGVVSTSGHGVRYKQGANRPVSGDPALNTDNIFSPVVATNTGSHMIIVHLDQTGATPVYTSWLDPNFASLGTGTAPTGGSSVTQTANTTAFAFNGIRLGEFDSTASSKPADFDELRIGTTWSDVSPVPEPTGAAALAGAALFAMVRRRSRRLQ